MLFLFRPRKKKNIFLKQPAKKIEISRNVHKKRQGRVTKYIDDMNIFIKYMKQTNLLSWKSILLKLY